MSTTNRLLLCIRPPMYMPTLGLLYTRMPTFIVAFIKSELPSQRGNVKIITEYHATNYVTHGMI